MRQQAWLDAVPEAPGKKVAGPEPVSRLKQFIADDQEFELPEVEGFQYLVGFLMEIGPTLPGGMGPMPLTHAEIRAWQDNIGLCLAPWEARFLRALSWEYLGQAQRSTVPGCPPPFGSHVQRAIVARKIDELFG